MASPRALGMKSMDRSPVERRERVFHESRFVEGVCMYGDLDICRFGNVKAIVDRGRRRAPILVEL